MDPIEAYESGVERARQRFASSHAAQVLTSGDCDGDLLHAWLVHFSALGVGMTEPVEHWIRRAGKRCGELGFDQLGQALQRHAKAEADHHLLMIHDLHQLCARSGNRFDPAKLLSRPWPASVQCYRQLHDDTISGNAPYAQIAIEHEIELLSLTFGQPLLVTCRVVLGEQATHELSFLREHVTLDVGHTRFNRKQMADFLEAHPQAIPQLIDAGVAALEAYREFIADCLHLAAPSSPLAAAL